MKKYVFLSIVLILSLIVIFYQSSEIPKHLAYDEVAFAQLALSLDGKPYTPYSQLATGHSTLYFYIILLSFKLFGVNTFALRLPSAFFGIASLLIFYIIMKKVLKNDRVAFSATLVLLTLRWFITFSRFAFEPTFLLFLELVSVWFLIKFIEKKSYIFLFLTSLFAGFAFQSYTPGRLFFLLPLLIILLTTKKIKYVLVYLLFFLISSAPLLTYLTAHQDQRLEQVSLFSDSRLSQTQKLQSVGENIKRTFLMFSLEGDMNGRHNYPGKPVINPLLGLLFLLGVGLAAARYRNIYTILFAGYFLLSLLPAVLTKTEDNPSMLRTFTAVVFIPYVIALILKKITGDTHKSYRLLLLTVIILALVLSSGYELRTYFLFQSRVMKNSFEVTCSLSKVIKYNRQEIPKKCRVQKNLF